MRTKVCLILSQQEAKDLLANWYADMIINDRQNLLEHIQAGHIHRLCPDLRQLTPQQVATTIAELNIAQELGAKAGADEVYVDLGDNVNETMSCVWNIENLEPSERALLRQKYGTWVEGVVGV